jgi:predicted nucleotide-binding protein
MFTQRDKIAKLQRLLKQIDERNSQKDLPILRMGKPALSVGSEEFQEWRDKVTAVVRLIFGEHSHYIDDFNEIAYTDFLGDWSGLGERKGIWKGLEAARRMLQTMVDEIESERSSSSAEKAYPRTNAKEAAQRLDSLQRQSTLPEVNPILVTDPRIVFVVHGRNLGRRDALFRFLRTIGLSPLEWSQAVRATGKASPYIGEVLDAAFSRAQAVVVLMTPDDKAYLRSALRKEDDPSFESKLTYQARPNVLFEAGMAMGRCAERTVLVQIGEMRPFSDIGGRHIMKLDNSTERRQELGQRLESAGCPVDLTGTQWHREGDFNILADESLKKL